ncbi:MAG TPA: CHAT domain-containing tetratricopeptide repeat protein, partial [Pyrinomonadaceae bacterium]|nr:CHAT domain-containing tetratricopeptide repeat protein [Pyrinomonadaceae bacterium]
DGKAIVETDLEIRKNGSEALEFVSLSKQVWKIEIDGKNKLEPPGSYDVLVTRISPATERDKSLFSARTLMTEAQRLRSATKYNEALAANERASAIFEDVLGPDSFEFGLVANRIGTIHFSIGDNSKSETNLRKALRIFEKILPPDSLQLADTLNNLGVIERVKGRLIEAESLFIRSMEIREKALGQEHRLYSQSLVNLGVLYRNRGDNDRAERTYEKALEIRERVLGKGHADTYTILQNIAAVKYYKGDYAAAADFNQRALEIARKNFGPDDLRVAFVMSDIGAAYSDAGRLEDAEQLYLETLRILEKKGNPLEENWSFTLTSLGRLYHQRGELEKARPLFHKAIGMAEKRIENDPLSLSDHLLHFGRLQISAGEFRDAEKSLQRALDISESALGAEHGNLSRILNALSAVKALQGNIVAAVEIQSRANRLSERDIILNLSVGTQHQRSLYLKLTADEFNQTIALDAEKNAGSKARELAVAAVLQRKGRVLDALASTANLLSRQASAEEMLLLQRLNDTNARLSAVSLNGPQNMKPEEYRKQVSEIQKEKDSLEIEISRRTAGFFQPSKIASPPAIRSLIPSDAVLVEFVTYRPIAKDSAAAGDGRYVAYVIRQKGDTDMVPIGGVAEIDSLIARYRAALRDPRRRDVHTLAKNVYARVMRPVRRALRDARHLIISPDGEMNLMPFESLIDESNKHVIESYALSYVTSGRDLVRMEQKRDSRTAPVIVANPDFGQASSDLLASTRTLAPGRRSITVTRELSGTYFAPLRGTAAEADAIRKLIPAAAVRTAADASESALKSVNAPEILHIATHGFFLQDTARPAGDDGRSPMRATLVDANIENPLLRSGLALTGANVRRGSGDDGILTALEASGLNLWGTKLVVLSACDTGVGEIRTGEGVFGLRRAFVLAGAESLVMSLWPVSDYVTRELMVGYYENLQQGIGRGESLRRAKLEMLRRPGRRHPFYWASFIQSGEWANLNDNR